MLGRSRVPWARAVSCVRIACLASLVTGGAAHAQENVGQSTSAVVYGTDDRVEYYEIPGSTFPAIARGSIVAMVATGDIHLGTPGLPFPPFDASTPTLDQLVQAQTQQSLCAGQRFPTQPSAAVCSGTLIDDDLVLTAGHCAPTRADCRLYSFVFDYHYVSNGVRESIDASDVYGCSEVLAHSESSNPHLDFAIVQLDRPVVGRTPADVRTATTALAVGTGLNVLGFGSGLPLKFDPGGAVTNAHATRLDTFVADTDTFAGNSGSGVFDDTGLLVGILVSGADDYLAGATCASVNVLTSAEAQEESTYVFHAIDAMCQTGFRSSLCPGNPAPSCGDHYCSGGEDASSCAKDCAAPHCGDSVCTSSAGETMTTCILDCKTPPSTRKHGRCSVTTSGATDASARGDAWLVPVAAATWLVSRRRRNR